MFGMLGSQGCKAAGLERGDVLIRSMLLRNLIVYSTPIAVERTAAFCIKVIPAVTSEIGLL